MGKNNYLNDYDFTKEILISKLNKKLSDRAVDIYMLLTERLSKSSKYIGYSDMIVSDLKGEAMLVFVNYYNTFSIFRKELYKYLTRDNMDSKGDDRIRLNYYKNIKNIISEAEKFKTYTNYLKKGEIKEYQDNYKFKELILNNFNISEDIAIQIVEDIKKKMREPNSYKGAYSFFTKSAETAFKKVLNIHYEHLNGSLNILDRSIKDEDSCSKIYNIFDKKIDDFVY